jgi:hypothetical protein
MGGDLSRPAQLRSAAAWRSGGRLSLARRVSFPARVRASNLLTRARSSARSQEVAGSLRHDPGSLSRPVTPAGFTLRVSRYSLDMTEEQKR